MFLDREVDPRYHSAVDYGVGWVSTLEPKHLRRLECAAGWLARVCDDTEALLEEDGFNSLDEDLCVNWVVSHCLDRTELAVAAIAEVDTATTSVISFAVRCWADATLIGDSKMTDLLKYPLWFIATYLDLIDGHPDLVDLVAGLGDTYAGTLDDLAMLAGQLGL
jgi:hypothetical protein